MKHGFSRIELSMVLVILGLLPISAEACTCTPQSRAEIMSSADAVALVEVVSLSKLDESEKPLALKYLANHRATLRVIKTIKGTLSSSLDIFAQDWGIMCGPRLEKGMVRELALRKSDGDWTTQSCQGELLGN